ncbi:50S ribosomal protein L9 [candidate division LCP-89 bacterium B3_LCP]|uniref:Large ribosomal subunit protein bL9 n=1 Tax=candidate division LCP-89 bacterium B3_LCP TaxID=2012998 RepID=A0A532UZJ7_UNCL8|nr:MAG: 50S ribosomal protein L9 [candidate division LCP-89 bacterium B3_LCP]
MKVILREKFETLGDMGTTLNVKDGYARNYLIPRGIAYPATDKYLNVLQEEEKLQQKKDAHKVKSAEQLAEVLSKATVIAKRKSGEEGKLFGSVTSQDITSALAEQGIELDRRKIVLDEPIRLLGNYQVRVRLHADVNVLIQVAVIKEEEEKK